MARNRTSWLAATRRIEHRLVEEAGRAPRRLNSGKGAGDGGQGSVGRRSPSPLAPLPRGEGDLRVPENWPKLPDIRRPDWKRIKELLAKEESRPQHPRNWHRRLVEEALGEPAVHKAYFAMRRALWQWEEFAALRPGVRRILDVLIELARDEALPWYVAVPSHEMKMLARLDETNYAECARSLECLAITRPARRVKLCDKTGVAVWPGRVEMNRPLEPIAQWVARYRRGIAWNRKRAAWWINYDLLCGTGRVLPCFEMRLETLAKTYFDRNRRMGKVNAGVANEEQFAQLERVLAESGPLPPAGLRTALWQLECSSRPREGGSGSLAADGESSARRSSGR